MNIITLFCEIDDFFLAYEKWVSTQCLPEPPPLETRGRPRQLHPSEVMTLLIAFHQSNYRTFAVGRGFCAFLRLCAKPLPSATLLQMLARPISTFISNMPASIGAPSFHIW